MTIINDSINQLVGTFAMSSTNADDIVGFLETNNIIAIDTSNNRLGINTIDPSYEIDINNGTLSTTHINISGNITGTIDLSNNLSSYFSQYDISIVKFIIPDSSYNLESGQIYRTISGTLKIKI